MNYYETIRHNNMLNIIYFHYLQMMVLTIFYVHIQDDDKKLVFFFYFKHSLKKSLINKIFIKYCFDFNRSSLLLHSFQNFNIQ